MPPSSTSSRRTRIDVQLAAIRFGESINSQEIQRLRAIQATHTNERDRLSRKLRDKHNEIHRYKARFYRLIRAKTNLKKCKNCGLHHDDDFHKKVIDLNSKIHENRRETEYLEADVTKLEGERWQTNIWIEILGIQIQTQIASEIRHHVRYGEPMVVEAFRLEKEAVLSLIPSLLHRVQANGPFTVSEHDLRELVAEIVGVRRRIERWSRT